MSGASAYRLDPLLLKPIADLDRVKPYEVPPLDVGDSALGDQLANVAHSDAEMSSEAVDRQELWQPIGSLRFA